VVTKLIYDPKTNKKLRPRFKFNGGRGAILCRKCGKIIKENISRFDLKRQVENIFCVECATEMLMKFFKIRNDEQTKSE
jgi:ribosomal protein S26